MSTDTHVPPSPRRRKQLHLWIDEELAEWIRTQAYVTRMSRSAVVVACLDRCRQRS